MTGTIRPSSPSETAMPRCTASWTAYSSPSSVAFTDGNSRSASIVARATIGRAVTPRRPRDASTPDMSASIHVVHVAAVSSERFMCSPIWRRMRDKPPAAAGAGAGSGLYGDSMCIGGSAGASTSARTSCLRTRPPRPVPVTRSRSIPCSAAMRCTTGEWRRGREPFPASRTTGAGSLVDGAGVSPTAAAASPVGRPSPPVSMRAITVPTSTVSSGWTRISTTVPAAGDSTSVSILSVEIAQITSSRSTRSPTALCHSTTVPSATETPIWGIVTSTSACSVLEELTARLPDAVDGGQQRLLERRRERDRHVGRRDPDDRPVEVLEALLGDQRRDLRPGRARRVGLVEDHHLRAASHALEDRLLVERHERTQVEHAHRRAVEVLGRLERGVHHRAVGDHREVVALARHARGERRRVGAAGDLALHAPVQVLVLEEQHGVRVADRADDQALGVLGGRRRHDLQPGRVHEPRLRVLRVEGPAAEAAAARQPHRDGDVQPEAVVGLAAHVDELVEAAGDEVGELHLADRPHAHHAGADGRADDRRLGQRRVHHAVRAELVDEAVGDLERAAEDPDVLAHQEHALVRAHLLAQAVADRLQVRHRRHRLAHPLYGACPSISSCASSAKIPCVAVCGSGIGMASASSTPASIASRTSSWTAATSTPASRSRASWRSIGSFARHSSSFSLGTYFMSSWAAWPCMRMVTASMSVGPPPPTARSRAPWTAWNIASASLPSTVTPGKP